MTTPEILRGEALFTADSHSPGLLHLHFVRSTCASARIVSLSTDEAKAFPGVVTVFCAEDLPIIPVWEIALLPEDFAQPPLAQNLVRYVGEKIVAIVAESLAIAIDAAELVVIEYESLPALTDMRSVSIEGAPVLFPEHPSNVCLRWPSDSPTPDLSGTDVVTSVSHSIPRLSCAPIEGHAIVATPLLGDRLEILVSTQVPVAAQRQIARSLQMELSDIRVVVPNVGGGFGGKAAGGVCEHVVVAAAARFLGRPVSFVEDRNANLSSMQGRGVRNHVKLHATSDGRVLAIEADITADAGAYPNVGAVEPGKTRMMMCGPYGIASANITAQSVVTNLPPVGAYRGPGRSEAAVMLERTLDVLADALCIDPVEIRRRNLLTPDVFPYLAPTGLEYDSGNYHELLDLLVTESGYHNLRQEQLERRITSDQLLGIGVSVVIDSTAWFSRTEGAAIRIDESGCITVLAGSASAGQQHGNLYRSIVQRLLPVDSDQIYVVEGDTDQWSHSDGTMGSRTAQLAGTAVHRSVERLYDSLREAAARQFEADIEDIVLYPGGSIGVRGVPSRSLTFAQLVTSSEEPIEADCIYEQPGASYPAAAHLSVVEIDGSTGKVIPIRHVAVTDCGVVLDPNSARSQVIGATAQGISQALYEEFIFDEDGNPLTNSFADYAVPSAAEIPAIETHFIETPSPRNPLGAKGVGEIGMIAAPVAVQNAVIDAVRHLGVQHLDMPCTPQKIWAAINHIKQ
ncbi:MAG: xanthine dehydrogenase family protein molybdopterin-binding subunit [Actinomycetes bacterium]